LRAVKHCWSEVCFSVDDGTSYSISSQSRGSCRTEQNINVTL